MPPTWPRIQLLGSGFGQYGSMRNAGLWALAGNAPNKNALQPAKQHSKKLLILPFFLSLLVTRHPEVRAKRASKDTAEALGPSNVSPAPQYAACRRENRNRSLRRPARCARNTSRRSRAKSAAAAVSRRRGGARALRR